MSCTQIVDPELDAMKAEILRRMATPLKPFPIVHRSGIRLTGWRRTMLMLLSGIGVATVIRWIGIIAGF